MVTTRQKLLIMMGKQSILERVLSTGPVCCNPLDDLSGTAARDASGNGHVGQYRANNAAQSIATWTPFDTTLGFSVPYFDGSVSKRVVDMLPAGNTFYNMCDWDEFSVYICLKVSGAAIWTDATARYSAFYTSANGVGGIQRVYMADRPTDNNTLYCRQYFNGTGTNAVNLTTTSTGWLQCLWTASRSANQAKFWCNGQQVGATQAVGDDWTATDLNLAVLGAANIAGSSGTWSGYLALHTVWNKVLSTAERNKVFF